MTTYPFAKTHYARTVVGLFGACASLLVSGCATLDWGGKPRDSAAWTIRCIELQGPNRVENIRRFADTLRRTDGIDPEGIFTSDDSDGRACLYYGRYYRPVDRRTGKRAAPKQMREALDLLRQLGDSTNRRYFLRALPVRMPTPDVGNPAWVLGNVRATYSLQVAIFEPADGFSEYKEVAARYCKSLRQRGYEAYYHHGSASSMVTVGSFGADAVRRADPDLARRHMRSDTAYISKVRYSPAVLTLQREELLKHNLVNGAIHRVRNPAGELIAIPSFLVRIPESRDPAAP